MSWFRLLYIVKAWKVMKLFLRCCRGNNNVYRISGSYLQHYLFRTINFRLSNFSPFTVFAVVVAACYYLQWQKKGRRPSAVAVVVVVAVAPFYRWVQYKNESKVGGVQLSSTLLPSGKSMFCKSIIFFMVFDSVMMT